MTNDDRIAALRASLDHLDAAIAAAQAARNASSDIDEQDRLDAKLSLLRGKRDAVLLAINNSQTSGDIDPTSFAASPEGQRLAAFHKENVVAAEKHAEVAIARATETLNVVGPVPPKPKPKAKPAKKK